MTQPSAALSSKREKLRWEGPAAMLGGSLWLLFYGASALAGRELGEGPRDVNDSDLLLLGAAAFCGAVLSLGTSLTGLRARLQGRARRLGLAGGVMAALALATAALNALLLTGLVGRARFVGGLAALGVLGVCTGAVLLGLATRREQVLPRWGGTLLIVTGPLTVLLIATSGLRFGSIPGYVLDDLPFAIAGLSWITAGAAMRSRGEK
ncbi:hypothetical protein KYC5002_37075 [Archangium violaceum]|uniref:hypothetical protein n=1 Tax=Archangium violaceum TaxID=83451 RepID=UPI002B3249FE|nr:hypothetical protein KYC5002_37075 [Archangium gephyra]